MFKFIKKIFRNKGYFISKNGHKYYECSKKDLPRWVHDRWKKIILKSGSDLDLENKTFYFKGKKFRYVIKSGLAIGHGGTSSGLSIEDYRYYKRKRTKYKENE